MKSFFVLSLVIAFQMIALVFSQTAKADDEVCIYEDINYSGRSLCMHVGTVNADLNTWGFARKISSVSIQGTAVVDLWDQQNYVGQMYRLNFSMPNLTGVGFNDRAVSMKAYVPAGRACFFADINYSGQPYRCFFPGQSIPNLVLLNFNDMISSVLIDGDAIAYGFHDIGFGGTRFEFKSSVPNLTAYPGWNDAISSIRVTNKAGI